MHIFGLDRRADVIADCRRIAAKLGCAGLEFRVGEIGDEPEEGTVDLAVSLHACDTATDDALARAVAWRAAVILAVPCCQHELAPKIHMPQLGAAAPPGNSARAVRQPGNRRPAGPGAGSLRV